MSEVSQSYRQADFDRIEALRITAHANKIVYLQFVAEVNHRRYERYRDAGAHDWAKCCATMSAIFAELARLKMGIDEDPRAAVSAHDEENVHDDYSEDPRQREVSRHGQAR